MIAIYDKDSNLVGWFNNDDKNIYDRNMNWLGFVNRQNIFNFNQKWIGGLNHGSFVDNMGRPVAWLEGSTPQGREKLLAPIVPLKPLQPTRPLPPIPPLPPLRPFAPLGGWSQYTWGEYWQL